MATLYYNTKTTATAELTKDELGKIRPEYRKRWREASESEIKLHEKRKEDQALLDKKEKERVKTNEKNKKAKEKALAKNKADSGSTDDAQGSAEDAASEDTNDTAE